MENVASVIPYLSVFFLPLILFCAPILWKWWDLPPGQDALLDNKAAFLNHNFFWVRYVAYFLGLGGFAVALRSTSMAQDEDGASRHTFRLRKLAIGGLPVMAVCLTFAAVDWLMGLDYHWFSTMWGVYIFAGAAGSSMALLVLIITGLKKAGYLKAVNLEHYHIMGKFMLAFTVFWAYIAYSQYMLIWYANIPEETIYFKIRNTEGWHALTTILVLGRFFIPFPILLFQGTKKNPKFLCAVACWIIAMQLLDHYIIVLPSLHQTGVSPSVYDFASVLAVAGAAAGFFFRRLASANIFPNRDPRLSGSVALTN
jgi:fucose 4-O-acetylase-like acetyltransferase